MIKKKVKINETYWTVKIVTSREMKKEREDGADIAGLCILDDKAILIHEHHIDERTIIHELFHAYFSELHLADTNDLSLPDIEEIMASFFSEKGEMVINKGKKLTKSLQKKYMKESDDE